MRVAAAALLAISELLAVVAVPVTNHWWAGEANRSYDFGACPAGSTGGAPDGCDVSPLLGVTSTFEGCKQLCLAATWCTACGWVGENHDQWTHRCFARHDDIWTPSPVEVLGVVWARRYKKDDPVSAALPSSPLPIQPAPAATPVTSFASLQIVVGEPSLNTTAAIIARVVRAKTAGGCTISASGNLKLTLEIDSSMGLGALTRLVYVANAFLPAHCTV